MDGNTPITLAAARYATREAAVADYNQLWDVARGNEDQFDHMAVAVLTKDDLGKLEVERHDSTAKHFAWGGALLGAALVVVAPPAGAAVLAGGAGAGAGALIGHFWHNIPKEDVQAAGELLEAGESGLLVVAVNRAGTDIEPLLSGAESTKVTQTTWGDLDAELEKELADAQKAASGS
jgi:hypothetical protein